MIYYDAINFVHSFVCTLMLSDTQSRAASVINDTNNTEQILGIMRKMTTVLNWGEKINNKLKHSNNDGNVKYLSHNGCATGNEIC